MRNEYRKCMYLRKRVGLKKLKEITRDWLRYYNSDRFHQSSGYKSPDEVYYGIFHEYLT